uniref:Allatostatin-A receptor-like n=1 Tax=Dermatophagoides pteronyssinus TaxID=6956 RepID=A0A6P6XWW9_DERPT
TTTNNNGSSIQINIDDISTLEILDRSTRTILVILYSATSVLAFVGNILVIIVEIFGRRSAASLRKFLINLAISDILFGVFAVPFTYTDFMFGRWIFLPWLCPWAQFIQILSIFITSFTLTVISIERYYAVKFPLSNQNKWLMAKSQYILIIGWLLGIIWASIPNTKIEQFVWDNQTYQDCRPDHELYESRWYNISSVMLTFGFPLIIQSICYASIIRCLLSKDNLQSSQSFAKQNRDMTRIIRMLVAVVILFLICWSPIKILMTVITYSPEWLFIHDPSSNNFYIASYFVCHWMAMANSFVNPIIYSFMSKSFRIDLRDLARKICAQNNDNKMVYSNNTNTSRHQSYYNHSRIYRSSYRQQNNQNNQQQQQQQPNPAKLSSFSNGTVVVIGGDNTNSSSSKDNVPSISQTSSNNSDDNVDSSSGGGGGGGHLAICTISVIRL